VRVQIQRGPGTAVPQSSLTIFGWAPASSNSVAVLYRRSRKLRFSAVPGGKYRNTTRSQHRTERGRPFASLQYRAARGGRSPAAGRAARPRTALLGTQCCARR